MHPRTAELFAHLESHRATLAAAIESVPHEYRETKPGPDRWSVANVLEHLLAVERVITRVFNKKLGEAQASGLGAEMETTSVVGTMNIARMLDRSHKIVAREEISPRSELDAAAAWAALAESRHEFLAAIARGDGLALSQVEHPHPIFGPLNLYQWVAFVGAHEARHAAQIREVGAQLAGSS